MPTGTNLSGIATGTTKPILNDNTGAIVAVATGVPDTTANIIETGALVIRTDTTPGVYINTGTYAAPTLTLMGSGASTTPGVGSFVVTKAINGVTSVNVFTSGAPTALTLTNVKYTSAGTATVRTVWVDDQTSNVTSAFVAVAVNFGTGAIAGATSVLAAVVAKSDVLTLHSNVAADTGLVELTFTYV